jgi:hypothetical protein
VSNEAVKDALTNREMVDRAKMHACLNAELNNMDKQPGSIKNLQRFHEEFCFTFLPTNVWLDVSKGVPNKLGDPAICGSNLKFNVRQRISNICRKPI